MSCLKRTRSGLSLGSPVVGLLTDHTNLRMVLGDVGLDVGGPGDLGEQLADHVLSLFRGTHGELFTTTQIGKVTQLIRPIVDKALGWL